MRGPRICSLAADEEVRGFSRGSYPSVRPHPGSLSFRFLPPLRKDSGAPRTASSRQALVGWIFHVLLQLGRPQCTTTLIIVVEIHCNYADQAPDTRVPSPHRAVCPSHRFDFIYDLFEHVSSRNNQDTLKCGSKHRRPTVSSQFKVSLHHWLVNQRTEAGVGCVVWEVCEETGLGFCSVTFLRQAELHR